MATQQIGFDPQAFRAALGTFTTGVTIITSQGEDGAPVGITANSFNSVSLNPPLVLWSLSKQARSLPVFSNGKHWNVHVLSIEQEKLSSRFATQGEDKFAEVELDNGISDAPLLQDCTARFQCRTAFQYEGGDHVIFVGEVLAFDHSDRAPLAFQSGQYALATRKPRSELRLATTPPPPECSYTEDLLGYLLGRSHYQVLNLLRQLLSNQQLDEQAFFVLAVLSIRDNLSLDELNTFVSYTGHVVTLAGMRFLERQGLVAIEGNAAQLRFVLTANGRELSLQQVALAKVVEEDLIGKLGEADAQALKVLLKRLIVVSDPGLPDLWAPR
ncbi:MULTISPECIES: flavin reductase family protein [Pseudomonas]|uniref:Peptidase n=3 Tax=Pseudomonas TaxID=286 RepID=A0A2R7UJP5_PSEDL|nr:MULTISPECIES: flavin reductase family protein [Pseudomonas]MRF40566.1 flavin reductase [Escherichia coli]MBF8644353.1 flavin reductase family protein [Pseudomonas pudica]MBF8701364.1 flavin reductase family protein [Pseudomonas putida]MBF8707877.1 flavin reductase family protein [Pseudomonas putida]MBF8735138.1 flavin reductase family protein [Pseudomonas putida]